MSENIHHIVPFSSRGSDGFHNLIVLCPDCHSKVHTTGVSVEVLRSRISYRLTSAQKAQFKVKEPTVKKKTIASKPKTTAKKITSSKRTVAKTKTTKIKPPSKTKGSKSSKPAAKRKSKS
jgi:hypothetical protein